MKKIFLSAVFVFSFGLALSATSAEDMLSTEQQQAGYAVGHQVGSQLLRSFKDDLENIDKEALFGAIADAFNETEPKLSDEKMRAAIQAFHKKKQEKQAAIAEENKKKGDEFRAENKKKEGVVETPSGLQYKVLTTGTGKQPTNTDIVTVHYKGTLVDGSEFDSSHKRGQPATFSVDGIIKGWQEALPLMKEGATWQVVLPPELAYGERGPGGKIGPNETLIFEIELLGIKAANAAEQTKPTEAAEEIAGEVEAKKEASTEDSTKEVESAAKEAEHTAKEVESAAKEAEHTAKEVESAAKEVESAAKEAEHAAKEVESAAKEAKK